MHVTEPDPSPRYWMPSLPFSPSPIAKHANPTQQPNIIIAGLSKNYAETISLIEEGIKDLTVSFICPSVRTHTHRHPRDFKHS